MYLSAVTSTDKNIESEGESTEGELYLRLIDWFIAVLAMHQNLLLHL